MSYFIELVLSKKKNETIKREYIQNIYHAAASVHKTIRLIEIKAKYNVFSQTGVKNVRLIFVIGAHKHQNETTKENLLDFQTSK